MDEVRDPYILSWVDVVCTLKSGRRVLRNVTGVAGPVNSIGNRNNATLTPHEQHADLFAILGPSGAGKTTLLDILAGRRPAHAHDCGDIRVNGQPIVSSQIRRLMDMSRRTTCSWDGDCLRTFAVPREASSPDDHVHERCPPLRELNDADLGIEKLADSFIGDQFQRGLSGGEKRRVSIATELLMSPGIMFLDEPTTGLDSTGKRPKW